MPPSSRTKLKTETRMTCPGGPVPYQFIGRPVAGVRVFPARAFRNTGPAGPEEECRQIHAAGWGQYRIGWHGVAFPQLVQGGIMTKQIHVMSLNDPYGAGPQRRQDNSLHLFVIGVCTHFRLYPGLQASLRFPFQVCIGTYALLSAPLIQEADGLAVEPVCSPVWCRIRAMPPDGTQFLSPDRSPDILASANLVPGKHDFTSCREDQFWNGRGILIDLAPKGGKYPKGEQNYQAQRQPQAAQG